MAGQGKPVKNENGVQSETCEEQVKAGQVETFFLAEKKYQQG